MHGHRNGFGMFSRHPALGMDFQPYQTLWRLAGVDHMHVHGLAGKFSQADAEVVASARDCLTPLADRGRRDDVVMPAFSSGQWAGTMPATLAAVPQRRPHVHVRRRHPRASRRPRRGRGQPAPGMARDPRRTVARRRGARRARAARRARVLRPETLRRRWCPRLRHVWYGDDFTGATDTLATLAGAGLRACCSCGVPTPRAASRRPGPLDALGIAGAARAMDPAAMRGGARAGRPLPRDAARAGTALQVLLDLRQLARRRQPRRGVARRCAATCATTSCRWSAASRASGATARSATCSPPRGSGGEVHRIDRHPTMSRHPVTPMHEADLRRHLALQGLASVALIDLRALDAPRPMARHSTRRSTRRSRASPMRCCST